MSRPSPPPPTSLGKGCAPSHLPTITHLLTPYHTHTRFPHLIQMLDVQLPQRAGGGGGGGGAPVTSLEAWADNDGSYRGHLFAHGSRFYVSRAGT